jgi:hypothetical protein
MGKLVRRNFLQVMCISPLGLRVDLPEAGAVKSTSDVRLLDALARRDAMEQRWLTVYEQLPEWVRAGYSLIDAAGLPAGARVGWPEACASEMIDLGRNKLVRPSPRDLWQLYQADSTTLSAAEASVRYRERCWQLIRRMRAKRSCLKRYELPTSADFAPIDTEIDQLQISEIHEEVSASRELQ